MDQKAVLNKIKEYIEIKKKTTTCQNVWDAPNVVLKEKFIASNL